MFKRLLIFVWCLLGSIHGFGQGIVFNEGGFEAALFKARQQNKLLFVEVYLIGCPHCAALAPVLNEKKVGDVFNQSFVSIKLEANSADSKYLQTAKRIGYPEFPLFFFFDTNGNLIHQASPSEMPSRPQFIEEVNRHAREALTPALRTSNYAARFAKGERNAQFLVNYGKYAKATKDTTRLLAISNELSKIYVKPADLESKSGFHVISRLVMDYKNPMSQYFFSHYNNYAKKHDIKEVKDAGEAILYNTLYGRRSRTLTADEIVKMRLEMGKLGVSAKEAGNRTLLQELAAHFRAKATIKATARLNEFRKTGALGFLDYAYLIRYFNENAKDNTYATSAVQWANDGLKLAKPQERSSVQAAEMNYQLSLVHLKLNNKVEAKKAAQQAVNISKITKTDMPKYVKHLGSLGK